jgi:hypothetical protein
MTHTLEGRQAPQAAAVGAIRSSSAAPEAVTSGASGPTAIGRQVRRPGQLRAKAVANAALASAVNSSSESMHLIVINTGDCC